MADEGISKTRNKGYENTNCKHGKPKKKKYQKKDQEPGYLIPKQTGYYNVTASPVELLENEVEMVDSSFQIDHVDDVRYIEVLPEIEDEPMTERKEEGEGEEEEARYEQIGESSAAVGPILPSVSRYITTPSSPVSTHSTRQSCCRGKMEQCCLSMRQNVGKCQPTNERCKIILITAFVTFIITTVIVVTLTVMMTSILDE